LGKSPVELAKLCQRAEFYNGVNCGIMDQFASAMGKRDHGILLDCNTLEYSHVPLNLGDFRIVITNTNKRRGLADSKYNERRAECEEALADLKKACDLTVLCDLTPEGFDKYETAICNEIPRKRAKHAVYENARTKAAAEAIQAGKWQEFAAALNSSHDSLRDLYEVSCDELDSLVNAAREYGSHQPGAVLGSRMTGAGFGGCTVSVVHKDHTDKFATFVGEKYHHEAGLTADFYVAQPGDGAREV
ncbi:MAG: galactokinase, partial [Defluviitaleaceae bacterium]|nr:galactokinase [Defluviitaleaceae bacterium]